MGAKGVFNKSLLSTTSESDFRGSCNFTFLRIKAFALFLRKSGTGGAIQLINQLYILNCILFGTNKLCPKQCR